MRARARGESFRRTRPNVPCATQGDGVSRRRPRIPGTTKPSRVLWLLPEIPDDAPAALKNALAIRNAANVAGVCPDCGACGEITGPDEHGFLHLTFEHEDGCGAFTDDEAVA